MSELYSRIGIDFDQLGCIMLDIADAPVFDLMASVIPPAVWYTDPTKPGEFGRESEPHVTLLFGLLTPGPEQPENVEDVLMGWGPPARVIIDGFASFGAIGDPYDAIVCLLRDDGHLVDAHQRLSKLPHIDTFPVYKPHVTIGYVLPGCGKWIKAELERFVGTPLITGEVNLGRARS